ncbi:DUF2946 family protein [Diaphorobacter aerolatus]|uniref:DUF2946 family protein n=1 Tax=Diaphorobacter aerolatus TaxID=1288495 RepID=A0A7H0GPW9_9BURK|nr:DUF2946 family protein [Diaphorobacter aerolatus]QNP50335.1 DUF2946 family protein [Diaphorobacter aerolatus]
MDDIVKQAMAKWPNVPACHGWLALDARGNWYLRDTGAQALGPFPESRGSRIEHEKLIDFIGRNYLEDDDGRWFFQNGPQRVFVDLENTPWVWRLRFVAADDGGAGPQLHIHTHTGLPQKVSAVRSVLMDEEGRLYLVLPAGLGVVHSQDMVDGAAALEAGVLAGVEEVLFGELPGRFGFERVVSSSSSSVRIGWF